MSDTSVETPVIANARVGRKRGPNKPKAQGTRGRPALELKGSVEIDDDFDQDGAHLTRRSNRDGASNHFEIPKKLKDRFPNWDFEYKTSSVYGQPVDGAEVTVIYEAGWRPVRAKDAPELCAAGWDKPTVERYGMTLYMRPMRLTHEAKREDYDRAERQKNDKLMSSMAVPVGRGFVPVKPQFEISGAVGTHKAAEAE